MLTPACTQNAIGPNGQMLVLHPSLLSRKPIDTWISDAERKAEKLASVAKAGVWIGGGLVVGGLAAGAVAVAVASPSGRAGTWAVK